MTIWRMWIVGQVDASIVAAVLVGIVWMARHRIAPTMRSAILLISLLRLAMPAFIQSPWSEAAVDVPLVDDARLVMSGALQDDRVQYLFAVTVMVSAMLLARLAWQVFSSRRRLLESSTSAPDWVRQRARTLAGDAWCAANLEVRLSDANAGPLAAGLRRPLIILPRTLVENLDQPALDAALAHEIAHHAKHDLMWIAAARALAAIAWFNPLAHIIAGAITSSREDGSDDWALARTSRDASTYADALLKSARLIAVEADGMLAAGAHPMGSRMRRLLDKQTQRDHRIGWAGGVVLLTLIALAVPGAHIPDAQREADGERIVIVIRK